MDGKIHPSGSVQQGGESASLVTAYAALRPRDGFSHPHQEHMKDTYIRVFNLFLFTVYIVFYLYIFQMISPRNAELPPW